MVHESRLIQLLIHGSHLKEKIRSRGYENILLSLITNHDSRINDKFKSRFTRKKKSLN